jgi:DNA polymerase I-like protein with 3'-5' exonuclease and polymerase domains
MRIVLDCESNLAHTKIWLVCTKNIDTGEKRTWKEASSLMDYLKDASLIVGHNVIAFDSPLLKKCWKIEIATNLLYDTLIVSRLLEPSRENGHSLEAWGNSLGCQKTSYSSAWQWLKGRREEYKGECFDSPHMGLLESYCQQDCEVTAKLYLNLVSELNEKQFSEESVLLEHEVAFIIEEQVRNGFKLDIPYATCLLTDIKGKLDALYEQMQERWPPVVVKRTSDKTGKPLKDGVATFNPASRKQIGEKLIELGWKPDKHTETGQPIVDEGVLSKIDLPEAAPIVEYLMLQKRVAQIESWLEAVGKDGRVHGKVITNGAVTGRMTHSSPNMAQIPNAGSVYGPECRECWTAEDGQVLVGIDASGLELRMLAHYMKDEKYVDTVTNGSSKEGTDVHTVNQKAAGLPTRDVAKTFIYAFLYGAGDAKIGSIAGGSTKEGKRLKEQFLKGTPSLAKLIKKVAAYAALGYVPGLDGRKIWVRSEHAALNSLLQGAGAIVMKKALCLFYNKCKENSWPIKLVANVHDEIQLETSDKYATIVGEAAVQSIVEAGEHFGLRCPLNGEYKIGRNWRETH